MHKALEEVAKDAMNLSPQERFELAQLLLEGTEPESNPEVDAAWEAEIQARIRAIDAGQVEGISLDEVMREVESVLSAKRSAAAKD